MGSFVSWGDIAIQMSSYCFISCHTLQLISCYISTFPCIMSGDIFRIPALITVHHVYLLCVTGLGVIITSRKYIAPRAPISDSVI